MHFLLVVFPGQGHISPARVLAHRLSRAAGARVTISTSLAAHRRMFPSSSSTTTREQHDDSLISYSPHSDGYDQGFNPSTDDPHKYISHSRIAGHHSLSSLARDLADSGRPITCVIYTTMVMSWAADVATDLGVPSFLFWPQAATVYAAYLHCFNGFADLISSNRADPDFYVNLPGLPKLQIRDFPSFLTVEKKEGDLNSALYSNLESYFLSVGSSKSTVLVNSFDALEPGALTAAGEQELVAIGPMVDVDNEDATVGGGGDLFQQDPGSYVEWLNSKEDGSVVYVSFGSLSTMSRRQMVEMSRGLEESGRPYLCVIRRDNRGGEREAEVGGEMGMVVEWCSQVRVLSHRAVGCFVTHCGWNSTLESLACGVPEVMVPQWTDQATNARLVQEEWGTGVTAEVDGEGVLEGRELRRCLDIVMGEEGFEIRRKAAVWRERAVEAVAPGGSLDRNLLQFLKKIGESVARIRVGSGLA